MTFEHATNRIEYDHPEANMYGCFPCPKCKGRHRYPTRPDHSKHPDCIICDECGFTEAICEESLQKIR